MSNRSFCHSLQKSKWVIALFCSFQKSNKKSDCSFALSTRAKKQKLAKNKRFSKWLLFGSKKRASAHFQNEQMANPGCRVGQSLICSFAHCSFPLLSKERLSNRLLICSFKKSDWAIALFVALCIRAIALFLLFSKEQQKEQLLFCSFKKSDKKSNGSFALSKRAKAKMSKKWEIFQIAHFSLKKKERLLIFKMSECPSLIIIVL